MEQLQFANWKPRASSLGYLMTCLPQKLTAKQEQLLQEFIKEKKTGINANGSRTQWTTTKQESLDKLLKIQEGKDELPPGAMTHLEDIFRSQYWKRKRLLNNKFLEKGIMCEEDALDLLSKVDGVPYWKNDEHLENDWVMGTPDNRQEIIRDMKTNYDMDSFDRAEMTSIYDWQVKAYCFLDKKSKGELVYALVNSPIHRLEAERKSLWYAMGMPEDYEERWIAAIQQLERNMIFDKAAFQKENPHYDFENKLWEYDIPPQFRIKRFPVTLEKEDIEHIERRVIMARTWLCQRELETIQKLNPAVQ